MKTYQIKTSEGIIRMLAVVALVLGSALLHTTVASAAIPGISATTRPDLVSGNEPAADQAREAGLEQAAGTKWVREVMRWHTMQPDSKSQIVGQAKFDTAIDRDRAAGMNVMIAVVQVPYWASADPAKYVDAQGVKHWNASYRPTNPQDFADFIGQEAAHLKDHGVKAYEVWNEENFSWPPYGYDVRSYLSVLKPSYAAIKQADPSAAVILGGLAASPDLPSALSPVTFMRQLYALGGRPYFDKADLHEYPEYDPAVCRRDASGQPTYNSFCYIQAVRDVMVANGDGGKGLWMSELGYSSCSPLGPKLWKPGFPSLTCFTEDQQADYLARAYCSLDTSYPYVEIAFWHTLRVGYDFAPTDFRTGMGLVRNDFSPKPAYAAYRDYAHGQGCSRPPSPHVTPYVPPAATTAPDPVSPAAPDPVIPVAPATSHRGSSRRIVVRIDGARWHGASVRVRGRAFGMKRRDRFSLVFSCARHSLLSHVRPSRNRWAVRLHLGSRCARLTAGTLKASYRVGGHSRTLVRGYTVRWRAGRRG